MLFSYFNPNNFNNMISTYVFDLLLSNHFLNFSMSYLGICLLFSLRLSNFGGKWQKKSVKKNLTTKYAQVHTLVGNKGWSFKNNFKELIRKNANT